MLKHRTTYDYPIDFTQRSQLVRDGHTYIRYGEPDAANATAARVALPANYDLGGGRVPRYPVQPPSETEHFDLDLQGKL